MEILSWWFIDECKDRSFIYRIENVYHVFVYNLQLSFDMKKASLKEVSGIPKIVFRGCYNSYEFVWFCMLEYRPGVHAPYLIGPICRPIN